MFILENEKRLTSVTCLVNVFTKYPLCYFIITEFTTLCLEINRLTHLNNKIFLDQKYIIATLFILLLLRLNLVLRNVAELYVPEIYLLLHLFIDIALDVFAREDVTSSVPDNQSGSTCSWLIFILSSNFSNSSFPLECHQSASFVYFT